MVSAPSHSDALMKLGLLGRIVGFIVMLVPIAGLDVADRTLLKSSMGLMGDGMVDEVAPLVGSEKFACAGRPMLLIFLL